MSQAKNYEQLIFKSEIGIVKKKGYDTLIKEFTSY